jgi:hypothetical protein
LIENFFIFFRPMTSIISGTCLLGGLPAEVELTGLLDRILAAPRHCTRPEK